jgi:hypothetical protein
MGLREYEKYTYPFKITAEEGATQPTQPSSVFEIPILMQEIRPFHSLPLDKDVVVSLTGPSTNFQLLSFEVPSQYVAVIREYGQHCSQDTIENNITWTFTINGNPISEYASLKALKSSFIHPAQTRIIVPQSSEFTVLVNTPTAISFTIGILVRGWFYRLNQNPIEETSRHFELWTPEGVK